VIDWRPIETVPYDGKPVLVWLAEPRHHSNSRVDIGVFHPKIQSVGGSFIFDAPTVTHWAPLPEGPSLMKSTGKCQHDLQEPHPTILVDATQKVATCPLCGENWRLP
jgi:hypothetical protein